MARALSPRSFPAPGHNHDRCAATALRTAETLCADKGLRFTALRRHVLGAIWESHAPVGAYDILAQLNAGGGRNAPMAVYRALDFLMENGLIHRVASLNAFIGCAHPGEDHGSPLLICRVCGTVAEFDARAVNAALARTVPGFKIESEIVEISGVCPHCRATPVRSRAAHG